MPNVRNPIRRWVDSAVMAALGVGAVPRQWAAVVDVTTTDANQVRLPAAARAKRFAGLLDMGNVPATIGPANDDPVAVMKEGRGLVNLPAGFACVPGDLGVIYNTSGDVVPYIPGTGGVEVLGWFKTKYTNAQSGVVPVEFELQPHYIYQVEAVRGFIRAIAANNTRYIGADATELAAVEPLFTVPWDGTLQGPFQVDLTQAAGNAGIITAKVMVKPPGGAWAVAQVGTGPADWAVALNAANVASADDTTVPLPYGNSLAVLKGTKVGFQLIKDANVANVSQLGCRITFVS